MNGREQAFYGADMVQFPTLGKDYVHWLVGRAKLNLDIDLATDVFQSLGSRPEPFRKALSQTRLQGALDPTQDSNAMLASLAAKGVSDSKTDFLNTVASLPPLQSALLRELAADSLLGPDVRRPGLFFAAMKARLLARLEAEMGAAHGFQLKRHRYRTRWTNCANKTFSGAYSAGLMRWKTNSFCRDASPQASGALAVGSVDCQNLRSFSAAVPHVRWAHAPDCVHHPQRRNPPHPEPHQVGVRTPAHRVSTRATAVG